MSSPEKSEVTQILSALDRDDPGAAARLLPMVYEELRTLAQARMRDEPANLTLQPTALVHEAYLRLLGDEEVRWNSRGHFFGAAAEAMRRILVERARKYRQPKYGGDRKRVPLEPDGGELEGSSDDDRLILRVRMNCGPTRRRLPDSGLRTPLCDSALDSPVPRGYPGGSTRVEVVPEQGGGFEPGVFSS